MKGTAANPQPTDGGVVLTLFLCVAAITYAMFSAIKLFVGAKYPKERNERRLVRLLSGSANLGNGIVHALLIAVLYANRNSSINFYVKELEEGYAGTRARSAQHANASFWNCAVLLKFLTTCACRPDLPDDNQYQHRPLLAPRWWPSPILVLERLRRIRRFSDSHGLASLHRGGPLDVALCDHLHLAEHICHGAHCRHQLYHVVGAQRSQVKE
jgi:hypothetical protein